MSPEPASSYGPRAGRRGWGAAILLLSGLVVAAQPWLRALQAPEGVGGPAGVLLHGLGGAAILVTGVLLLSARLRGVPRLLVDGHGLRLRGTFGTRSASWDQLGPFVVSVAGEGRRGERLYKAVAPVIAPPGSRAPRRPFVIPDAFEVPLAAVLRDLAARRGDAVLEASAIARMEAPHAPYGAAGSRWPWLTALLLLVFAAVFLIVEHDAALAPAGAGESPAVVTLVALGGLNAALVRSGQAWRMLTAPFLHASIAHLAANGVAFLFAGYALERLVGRAWTFCIFAAGALAGSAASLALGTGAVSVGASGAIMAMLVALFTTAFRLPSGPRKRRIHLQSARIAVPALIPVGGDAVHVDYGAHLGGALLGAALGGLLLLGWRPDASLPGFRRGAAALAAAASFLFVWGGLVATLHYPDYAVAPPIPAAEFPRGSEAMAAQADDLLARYPADPRSHMIAAATRFQRGDMAGGEREERTALQLAEASPWRPVTPALVGTVRATLARVLLEEGRRPEAEAVAQEACTASGDAAPPPPLAAALARAKLCGRGR